ncbi:MAG: trehalose-phosphatase [Candidatus Eisenbacteria bacterium]|nr:trehalose-phosphatase [Candidatus Eisenbacteria bacterium]
MSDLAGIPGFWDTVAASGRRCLVLDYDGTLAPFNENRMQAYPLAGIRELLLDIRDSGRTHLAIMTGRPLFELLTLLGDLDIPVSGSQGTEFRFPDGTTQTHLPNPIQEERLIQGEAEARAIAPSDRVERKIASVAVHTRGMPERQANELEERLFRAWSVDADAHELERRRFSGGAELRLKGIDKGTALAELLNRHNNGMLCVYIGDDETDEDAFKVIRGRGFGIKVGADDASSAASGRLSGPEAVREFLRQWLTTTTRD